MRVIESRSEMSLLCLSSPHPLGLVPTMGYLHRGHMALVDRARSENATVAASIFVNPTQFGPEEDLASYPRDMQRDLAQLEKAGVDIVFVPHTDEIYPRGFDTWIEVGQLSHRLEGAHRPGHIRGVATIVAKLFNIIRPDRAYFGQKDGQQAAVIKRLASDLDTGINIVVVPTVREDDGLALSSRNVYLEPAQRASAAVIYAALSAADALWRNGERQAQALKDEACRTLRSEPEVTRIDYISVADADTLEELETVDRRSMMSVAVQIGKARLIDNVFLG